MITLYRLSGCPRCTAIEEVLREMAVAHSVVEVDSVAQLPNDLRETHAPPILVDGDEVIQGSQAILIHLEELAHFKELWYKFQSDACYCDEQGHIE